MNEKVTLTVHGRKLTIYKWVLEELLEKSFPKEELIAELESYAANKGKKMEFNFEVSERPAVGKAFHVKPMSIDRNLFLKRRTNQRHETVRQRICKAFVEVEQNPAKYSKDFFTIVPKKTWNVKSCAELEIFARENHSRIADWVHQALEWAQRIANGESWDDICVYPDTLENRRIVLWNNGFYRKIGDSITNKTINPPAHVDSEELYSLNILSDEVPLLVVNT